MIRKLIAPSFVFLLATVLIGAMPTTMKSLEIRGVDVQEHTIPAENAKATVLFFIATECPIANSYARELNRLYDDYADKGIALFLVYPDPTLTAKAAEQHLHDYELKAPAIIDKDQILVKATGATKTPEAAIISPKGEILYLGRIDNKHADYGKPRPRATKYELRDALDEILASKPVSVAHADAVGCYILEPKPDPSAQAPATK